MDRAASTDSKTAESEDSNPQNNARLSPVSEMPAVTNHSDEEDDDDGSCDSAGRPHTVRQQNRQNVNLSTSSDTWESTIADGFVKLSDPFDSVLRDCPKQAYHPINRYCKPPEADSDGFGTVSGRALPEHYYANTGNLGTSGRQSRRERPISNVPWRDRNAVADYSHPRCFANPKNNVKLVTMYDNQFGFLDTNLIAPITMIQSTSSKMIRFDSDLKIVEVGQEYTQGETDNTLREDAKDNSEETDDQTKKSLDTDHFYYGQKRPGVKSHSCSRSQTA